MKDLADGTMAVLRLCTREVENSAPSPTARALPDPVHEETASLENETIITAEGGNRRQTLPASTLGQVLQTLYAKIQTSTLRFTNQIRTIYRPLRTFTK
jgi:hypothetical protein